jgi:hypothetical protein
MGQASLRFPTVSVPSVGLPTLGSPWRPTLRQFDLVHPLIELVTELFSDVSKSFGLLAECFQLRQLPCGIGRHRHFSSTDRAASDETSKNARLSQVNQ